MFTADIIDANEAVRIGLAEYAVPLAGFEKAIEDIAARIVANSPFSHAGNKRLLESTDGLTLADGVRWEVSDNPGVGPDMLDRIDAFTRRPR
jgi:enoyl-CoA hydratase/carnithine racemase